MRKIIGTFIFATAQNIVYACAVCERNKPKVLQGITHGSNPESNWDYVIVLVIGAVAILTLIYSIKYFVKPNENNVDHIKYSFLNEQ